MAFHSVLPSSGEGVNFWCGACMALFMLIAWGVRAWRRGVLHVETGEVLVGLFNGASFGTGSLLFISLFHPPVLKLMSDHALWIGVAGAAAMVASFSGLIPKAGDELRGARSD